MIIVVGAGPGIGASVARAFGAQGYAVALIARGQEYLDELGAELQEAGVTTGWTPCDITDSYAVTAAVERFAQFSGQIDVVHFNPSAFRQENPLHLTPAELLDDLRLGVASLLSVVQAAKPHLAKDARIVVTGSRAADRPWHEAASLGVQKAAVRNLVQSIDATLSPEGVRAVTVTVNGTLEAGTPFAPEHVAEAILAAVRQPADQWQVEVPFNG